MVGSAISSPNSAATSGATWQDKRQKKMRLMCLLKKRVHPCIDVIFIHGCVKLTDRICDRFCRSKANQSGRLMKTMTHIVFLQNITITVSYVRADDCYL